MPKPKTRLAVALSLLAPALSMADAGGAAAGDSVDPPILAALTTEMARAQEKLKGPDGERPYYIQAEVVDSEQTYVSSSWGALLQDATSRTRNLDVDLRVGSYELDNTHELRGDSGSPRPSGRPPMLPLDDEPLALRHVIWAELDEHFKDGVERLRRVKTSLAVKAEAEDRSADFSKEESHVDVREVPQLVVDRQAWAATVRRASGVFLGSEKVYEANVSFETSRIATYFASTDGSRVVHGTPHGRVAIYGATRADDGMELFRYSSWDARRVEDLPKEEEIVGAAAQVMADLERLRVAPLVEPFTGPAILSGRAAAVFFHEIFGHRIEGHRQKSEDEGQTFTKRIGEPVLPPFLSVVDDPTRATFEGVDLMGAYPYDNEGVVARRVDIVKDGVLRAFLMGRSPVLGFDASNGHGRRQAGYPPVGRQGNLMVESSRNMSEAELRALLKKMIREQGKPFGLYFDDISGGFTFTQRQAPQAYKVLPIMVYRVFPDDRPDELVRGVDIVGTPLASFSKIVATGGATTVFNGICGAESGYVPVSAASPSILVSELEIEKRAKGVDRPPILPAPTTAEATR